MRLNVLLTIVIVCLLGCSGPSRPGENVSVEETGSKGFIRWATDHALEIPGTRSSATPEIDERFRDAIGQVRVVGLGESRHDSREQLQLKTRFVRFLVQEMGFRTLILEESFSHAVAIDNYVTTGDGDLRAVMNRLAGWYLWDTEEMLELVEWMRSFNNSRALDQQLRVYGMDIAAPADGVRQVVNALESAGVKTDLDLSSFRLDLHEGNFWPTIWQRYAALSDEERAELAGHYDDLVEIVEQQRSLVAAWSTQEEFERTRWLAEVGRAGHRMFSTTDRAQGGAVREHAMAQTVLWILNRAPSGGKAIMWAHNLHVAKSAFQMPELVEGTLEPMGIELDRELGGTYLAIGGAFGSGSYSPTLPPGARVFEVMDQSTMDGALAAVEKPVFWVDLREAAENLPATTWLQQERAWRAQDANSVLVPSEAFDLVYFVEEISRSQPTPLALESFQELQQ